MMVSRAPTAFLGLMPMPMFRLKQVEKREISLLVSIEAVGLMQLSVGEQGEMLYTLLLPLEARGFILIDSTMTTMKIEGSSRA
jgi:hypothetical protein